MALTAKTKKIETGCFSALSMAQYLNILAFAYEMEDDSWSKRCFEKNSERFAELTEWQEDFEQSIFELEYYTTTPKYKNHPDTLWMQPFAPIIQNLFQSIPKMLKWAGLSAKLPEFEKSKSK